MSTNPYQSPAEVAKSRQDKERRRTGWVWGVLGVFGFLMAAAMLLPNLRRGSRRPAQRSMCTNNLKMIALALRDFEADHGALPPAYTVDAEGKPLHSWRTLILPYMGFEDFYQTIDLTKPWNNPVNKAAFDTPLVVYQCPSASLPPAHTTYFASVGDDRCLRPTEPRKLSEITDPHGRTIMLFEVESSKAVHWMSPEDSIEPRYSIDGEIGQPHKAGVNVAFVDGTVRTIRNDLDEDQLRALLTIAGNDDDKLKLNE